MTLSEKILLITSIVSAATAVFAILFAIRNRMVDKKKELTISYTTRAMFIEPNMKYMGIMIEISLLNTGNITLFADRPYIRIPYKKDGFNQFAIFEKNGGNYPVKLEPGEEHIAKVDLLTFLNNFSYLKWYRRIRFEGRDSKGTIYKSKKNWFRYFIKQKNLHHTFTKKYA